jgi:hypothetical protein
MSCWLSAIHPLVLLILLSGVFQRPSTVGAQVLPLPPRAPGAPSGSAFGSSIATLPRAEREEQIVRQVLAGNVPDFLRVLVPVQMTGCVGGVQKTTTIHVTPDYIAIGSDSDYFLIPMSPLIAQRIADSTGCVLPTRTIVDAVYAAAPLKFSPKPIAPSAAMITVPVFLAHNDSVQQQRVPVLSQFPQGVLVGGTKKDVIISNRIYSSLKPTVPKPVVIYGWHQLSGVPIQPVYNGHEETYADYSHGIRLVQNALVVDGLPSTVTATLADPQWCSLLSDEGVIALARYSYVLPTDVEEGVDGG